MQMMRRLVSSAARRSCRYAVFLMSFVLSLLISKELLASDNFQFALGGSIGLQVRKDYGEGEFKRIYPELVALGYVPLPVSRFWLRPALRLAYVSEQPEMPKGLRLEERDLVAAAELGVVYDWYVIPSVAFAGGITRRRIELKTQEPIEQKESINSTEILYFTHAQVGLGVPLGKGFAVVEPFYRYEIYAKDSRISSHYGLEISFQVF